MNELPDSTEESSADGHRPDCVPFFGDTIDMLLARARANVENERIESCRLPLHRDLQFLWEACRPREECRTALQFAAAHHLATVVENGALFRPSSRRTCISANASPTSVGFTDQGPMACIWISSRAALFGALSS